MKRLTIIRALASCLIFLFTSCEKELDFKYHEIDPLTVIEAELTDEGAKVGITLTTPMGEPMDTTRLTDAIVIITDTTDGTIYNLECDSKKYYSDPTPGKIGHKYRLTVEREGHIYEAETIMYPPVKILSLQFNWINMPYDKVAVFQGQFSDAAEAGQCYWIKLYRNDKIYLWQELDDRGVSDGIKSFMTLTTRQDINEEDESDLILDGDVITFSVSPISRKMHDYLEGLQNDSNGEIMFSGERCLGYFIATTPVSDTITFRPASIPVYKSSGG